MVQQKQVEGEDQYNSTKGNSEAEAAASALRAVIRSQPGRVWSLGCDDRHER